MFDKISRSWHLVKASAGVLRSDKELLLFPVISGIATLLVAARAGGSGADEFAYIFVELACHDCRFHLLQHIGNCDTFRHLNGKVTGAQFEQPLAVAQ